MVLTQKFRDELRKQGREEGREEERKVWVEWIQRRRQALAEGRDFTEPPPSEK